MPTSVFDLSLPSAVLRDVRLTVLVSIVSLASDDYGTCMYSLIAHQSDHLVTAVIFRPTKSSERQLYDHSLTVLYTIG